MKDKIQIEGNWWFPEKPENKIAGILRYELNEEPDLKLFGNFDPNRDFISKHFTSGMEPPAIILGEDENANKITLLVLSYGKNIGTSLCFISKGIGNLY